MTPEVAGLRREFYGSCGGTELGCVVAFFGHFWSLTANHSTRLDSLDLNQLLFSTLLRLYETFEAAPKRRSTAPAASNAPLTL